MKISILLPYKENFCKSSAGAVSIFVNDTNKLSKYKNDISVFGSTTSKNNLENYINIDLEKNLLSSTSTQYLKNFLNYVHKEKIEILEIHNRPHYIDLLKNSLNLKKFYFFTMILKKCKDQVQQEKELI